MYFHGINDDVPFFFGYMKDASNNPIVGDGSKLNPTKLFVTSLKLLKFCDTSNQNFMGMFHVDGTYRIVQNRFPMAVFGRSDINRKFFLIALALLSTEEAINYSDFFMAIIQVCHDFRINFVVQFIMMDAANEEAKAARNSFLNCIIIMCWFHLVKNVRDPKHAGSKLFKDTKIYDMIMADINTMHFCTSQQSFNDTTTEILNKWSCLVWSNRVRKELLNFRDYFIKQWLNPPFNNWQTSILLQDMLQQITLKNRLIEYLKKLIQTMRE